MRWPLRYQILAPFAAVMLLASAGVSLLDAYLAARSTEGRIQSQLREVARTLLDSSFPLTDRVLRQTHGLSGAEFVLTTESGRVLASSLREAHGAGEPPKRSDAATAGDRNNAGSASKSLEDVETWATPKAVDLDEDFQLGSVEAIAGRRYFHQVVAVGPRAAPAAENRPASTLLHILYPESVLREALWQAIYPPLLVGLVMLGVVMLLAVVIAARLSRPILELRRQVGRLAQGAYEPAALPPRNDELRDLVASVNLLAERLGEMRRAIKRTERLTLLGQLSGGLAHHLRNDVTGARLAVQLHQRRCREIDQESLSVALRQLEFTEEHLQKFLAAGQPQPLRRIDCSLEEVFAALSALVEPACRHRKVRFEIVDAAMKNTSEQPETATAMKSTAAIATATSVTAIDATATSPAATMLWADPEQLRQLLLNLALNGIDAAGPGGWVRIEYQALEREVRVRVVDSGPGPPAEVLERLFEAFATSKPEGVGLGLAVARQIAAAHGGALEYSRRPQTCFELTLPRAADEERSAPAADKHLAPATEERSTAAGSNESPAAQNRELVSKDHA